LIEVQASAGLWTHWLRRAGYRGPAPAIAATYETNQLKNEAAASGMGVALAVPLVTERFLADDRLVACAAVRSATDQSYCLHYAGLDVRSRSDTKTLFAWLKAEAHASLAKHDAWFERAAFNSSSRTLI
jgi:LysR family glycine cleavage system transcriptional activator